MYTGLYNSAQPMLALASKEISLTRQEKNTILYEENNIRNVKKK
jgi:hypothetical protein